MYAFNTLYDNLVQPIISYASAIWGQKGFSCINAVQNRACRFFLSVGRKTPNLAVRGEMGWFSQQCKQNISILRFWRRIHNLPNQYIVTCINSWSRKIRKSWYNNALLLISSWKLPVSDLYNISESDFSKCKLWLQTLDDEAWHNDIWNDAGQCNGNKLRTYRLFKIAPNAENYVTSLMERPHRSIFSKLRCGTLPLEIEVGRFAKPKVPLDQRICRFCDSNSIEDEVHFLINCSFYSDLRYEFWNYISSKDPLFAQLSPVDQFVYLMLNNDDTITLSAIIYRMFNRRKMSKNM